jgi:AAA+ ATPase superfamily predicted ATPase
MARFVGRRRELQMLERLWSSKKPELLILYGRRRVGKTRLMAHWVSTKKPRTLYWVAEPTSASEQLRSFSQAIQNFERDTLAPEAFTFATWEQAFRQAVRLVQQERLALLIDEFTYLLEIEPGIAGTLQKVWDHEIDFKQGNLLLCLSGSHIGMMGRHVLSYQSPLYGRATAAFHLQPLPFADTRLFFPDYQVDERVLVYAMLGGIPAYWERFDPTLSVTENIRQQFLAEIRLLHDEPRLLLHDFLTDLHNYVAILRAIANGYRTPKAIAENAGLDSRHISMYLKNLIETGFVERRVPVTASPSSRLGRHHITDPFLRFYYRFLAQRQAQIAMGIQDQALKEIKRHLRDFVGTHTWEELCREWVLRASAQGHLPVLPDQVGSAWTINAQVDVVGYNPMEKTMILGECKWSAQLADRLVMRELVAKTAQFVPKRGAWRVFYLGFARRGWTSGAQTFAAEVSQGSLEKGENWESVGMRLLDLDQVDRDLGDWTV